MRRQYSTFLQSPKSNFCAFILSYKVGLLYENGIYFCVLRVLCLDWVLCQYKRPRLCHVIPSFSLFFALRWCLRKTDFDNLQLINLSCPPFYCCVGNICHRVQQRHFPNSACACVKSHANGKETPDTLEGIWNIKANEGWNSPDAPDGQSLFS